MDYKLRAEIFKAIASRIYDVKIVEKLTDSIMHEIEISGTITHEESQNSKSNEQQEADSKDTATDIKAIRKSLEKLCKFFMDPVDVQSDVTATVDNEALLKGIKEWRL